MTPAIETSSETVRWRFSLRSAFLTIVCIALLMAVWVAAKQSREQEKLWTELRKLRNEVGAIVVEPGQEHLVHAVAVPTTDDLTWQWRVYIPPGANFTLQEADGEIPFAGQPTKTSGAMQGALPPGEHFIRLAVRRRVIDDQLEWYLRTDSGSSIAHDVSPEMQSLLKGHRSSSGNGIGLLHTSSANEPLELLRYRSIPGATNVPQTVDAKGILIWIRPTP